MHVQVADLQALLSFLDDHERALTDDRMRLKSEDRNELAYYRKIEASEVRFIADLVHAIITEDPAAIDRAWRSRWPCQPRPPRDRWTRNATRR